jgi:hypothetical protein
VNEKRSIEEKGRAERDGVEPIMEIESEGAFDLERPAPPELIDQILARLSEERDAQRLPPAPPDIQLKILGTAQTSSPGVAQGGSEDPAALTAAFAEVDLLLPLLARPAPPGLVEKVLANLAAERDAALAEVDQLLPLLSLERELTRRTIAPQRWCAFIGAVALSVTIAFIIAMASGIFGHDVGSEKAAVTTTQHAVTSMHYPAHPWLTYARTAAMASTCLAAALLGVLSGLIAVRRSIMSRVLRRIGADQVQPLYAEVQAQVDQDDGIGGSRRSGRSFPRMIRDRLCQAKGNFWPGGWRCLTLEILGLLVVGVTLGGGGLTSYSAAVTGGILTACVAVVLFSLVLALTVVSHAVGDLKTDLTTFLRIGAMFGHHGTPSLAPRRTRQ